MNEQNIYKSKFINIWKRKNDFGLSVILNFDYFVLIIRIGNIIFIIGSQEKEDA